MTDSDSLAGKRYLVGGATKGLGFAIAQLLVDSGAEVTISGRSPERLASAQQTLGVAATAVVADAGDQQAVLELARHASADGALDGIVINSGGPPAGDVLKISDDAWIAAFSAL